MRRVLIIKFKGIMSKNERDAITEMITGQLRDGDILLLDDRYTYEIVDFEGGKSDDKESK